MDRNTYFSEKEKALSLRKNNPTQSYNTSNPNPTTQHLPKLSTNVPTATLLKPIATKTTYFTKQSTTTDTTKSYLEATKPTTSNSSDPNPAGQGEKKVRRKSDSEEGTDDRRKKRDKGIRSDMETDKND